MWPFRQRLPQTTAQKLRAGTRALVRGDYPSAIRWLHEVVTEQPDEAIALLNLGAGYHCIEQHSRAVECFERVLARHPNRPKAWLNLAAAHSALGHLSVAEAALTKVVELAPHYPDVYYNLAVLKLRQGCVLEALAQLELQMADNPRHARARELVARLRAEVLP